MKSSWDVYLERQLRQPQVKKAFDVELQKIGMASASGTVLPRTKPPSKSAAARHR